MKIIKEQLMYNLEVPHDNTIKGALKWWIKRKNRICKSFCPLCEYYFRCQEDVAYLHLMEENNVHK